MNHTKNKELLVRCHDFDEKEISQEECYYLSQKERTRVDRMKNQAYEPEALDRAENACISCYIDPITQRY